MRTRVKNPQVLLVIGWREGKRYKLGRVDTEKPVTDYLADLAATEESRLRDLRARSYSVESTIDEGEYFTAAAVVPNEEQALRSQLTSLGSLPLITVDALEQTSLSFYAVTVGSKPAQVKAFIKKTNPLILAKPGGLLAAFGDSLTSLEKPVFAIAPSFDLIVYPDHIVILREKPFEALFYDATGINLRIVGWIEKISKHLPMLDETKAQLVKLCQKRPRLRLKLQAIEERGHLTNVTISKLRAELKRLRIPAKHFVEDGKLIIPESQERLLLEVLNEDLFTGGFSGVDFAAERKSRVTIAQ